MDQSEARDLGQQPIREERERPSEQRSQGKLTSRNGPIRGQGCETSSQSEAGNVEEDELVARRGGDQITTCSHIQIF